MPRAATTRHDAPAAAANSPARRAIRAASQHTSRQGARLDAWLTLLGSLHWAVARLADHGATIELNPTARRDLAHRGRDPIKGRNRRPWDELIAVIGPDLVLDERDAGLLVWHPQAPADPPGAPQLSPREHEILHLLRAGKAPGEIATILRRSRRTIEKHQQSLYRKLGVTSAQQAVLHSRP